MASVHVFEEHSRCSNSGGKPIDRHGVRGTCGDCGRELQLTGIYDPEATEILLPEHGTGTILVIESSDAAG